MRLDLWKLISKYIKTIRYHGPSYPMCLGIWLRYKIRNTKIKIRTGLLHMHGKPGAGRTLLLCSLSALEYRSRKPSVVTNNKEFLLSTRILNWILGKWFIGVRARAILLTKTYRMQNVDLSSRKPKGKRERKDKKRMWTYQQAIGYLKLQMEPHVNQKRQHFVDSLVTVLGFAQDVFRSGNDKRSLKSRITLLFICFTSLVL